MLKENGMEKPSDKIETASKKGITCVHCDHQFEVSGSVVFGEEQLCPRCGLSTNN